MIEPRGAGAAVAAMAIAAALACGGCGGESAEIELVVVRHVDGCGQVANAASITITALGEAGAESRSLSPADGRVTFDDFPPDLRQLALEVTGGGVTSIGKTAPFTIDTAPSRIPIAIAPPERALCPVGALAAARKRPLVARAGDGALVIGGAQFDAGLGADVPVATAEYFDPLAGGFTPVQTPTSVSYRGAAIAPLPDGRVFVLGGLDFGGYAVFDPTRAPPAFEAPGALAPPRALAQVIALDAQRVLIAGGCSALAPADDRCASPAAALAGVSILDLDTGLLSDRPPLQRARAGGIAALQHDEVGNLIVALAGGVDADGMPLAEVERISLGLTPGTLDTTADAAGLAVVLDSGAILTAFAPVGQPASAGAHVAVPGRPIAAPIALPGVPRRDAALVLLEDGTVVAIGGVTETPQPVPDPPLLAPAAPLLYRPMQGWRTAGLEPAVALLQHGAARLADGSVLVVGGAEVLPADPTTPLPAAVATAFRYRPSLLGPFEASATVTPGPGESDRVQLTPLDPENVTRPDGELVVRSEAGLGNWVVVSGPRFAEGRLEAAIAVLNQGGGFGLIARATTPDDRIDVVLVPQVRPAVDRRVGGVVTRLCEGADVFPTLTGTAAITVAMTIVDQTLRVTSGNDVLIDDCDLGDAVAPASGLWGVSAVGGDTRIRVDTVRVERGIP